jgi:hypothetical protein
MLKQLKHLFSSGMTYYDNITSIKNHETTETISIVGGLEINAVANV